MSVSSSGSRRVTLQDIARHCGVSKQVVSAVLNNSDRTSIRFSDETRRKVTRAAKDLGYRPNRTSKALASRQHGSFSIVFRNYFLIPQYLLNFLVEAAQKRDLLITLERFDEEIRLPRAIREDSCD
ncbi:MAG: LacI family transcriptional regulator, partial [Lentisphaerae bacterium]